MDKKVSMNILDECINWLQNASDVQIETMQNIYREEKKTFFPKEDGIEILLPSQMKTDKFIVEKEKVDIPNKKVKVAIENNDVMKYCKNEFNEANMNEWEDFAAQENKVKESKFKFKNPVLESLVFNVNKNFNEEQYDGIDIAGETKIAKIKEKNQAIVKFSLEIGEKGNTTPFYLHLIMKAEFKWTSDMEDEMVNRLLKANAPSLLLAYMRPIAANITGSSEYPMFNIPYMDMSENGAEFEEIEEE